MSRRFARILILMLGGVALLMLAIVSLVPAAVPSDPAEGGEAALNLIRLASLALSTLLGSASAMLFIRAIFLMAESRVGSRRSLALCGALLMGYAILLMFGRVAMSSVGPLMAILAWYCGGGLLLTASFPTSRDDGQPSRRAR